MKDLVTVVIPVYNTETYLDICVSSVAAQTYQNLQILLIDDGSTDASPRLCDEWAVRDSRVTVIHKQNEGLGMARNTGMEHAAGEHICFLDSDDFLAPETIELARKVTADVVFYGFREVDKAGDPLADHIPNLQKRVYHGEEVLQCFLPMLIAEENGLRPSACWAMFSMERIKRATWRFPSEREVISEDIYALLALFRHVETVAILPKALYCYRKNPASLSRAYRADRFAKAGDFYDECMKLCENENYPPEVRNACREPFLALSILAMKLEPSDAALRNMIEAPLLQDILRDARANGWKRRCLFRAIRRRHHLLCRILLAAQRRREQKLW